MTPDDPRHGQERGYFAHRKAGQKPCQPCIDAHCVASKRRAIRANNGQPALVPALGSQRRIRALAAIGWPFAQISAELGRKATHESIATLLRQAWVQRETANRIDAVYRRLCMTPGPNPTVAKRAQLNHWAPPLAWDDIDDPDEEPSRNIFAHRPRKQPPATILPPPPKPRRPVSCGTERGYQWHRQLWRKHQEGTWPLPADDPCGCRGAHRAHEAFRTQTKAARSGGKEQAA